MTKKSIHQMPVLAGTLRRVDADVREFGLPEALRRFTHDLHTKLEYEMPEETKKILASGRVVLIGNHPTDTEPFALFACLPPRRDARLIVSDCMSNLSKAIDEHMIPVHVREQEIHEPLGWRPTAFLAFATTEKKTWTSEEAHRFNLAQMKKAAAALKRGDLIMIFPGRRAKDGRWFPGVGHLVKDAKTPSPAYAVFSFVSGTSTWDFLRLIPGLNRLMPRIHVNFSKPVKVNALQTKEGKEIAQILEDKYEAWARTL